MLIARAFGLAGATAHQTERKPHSRGHVGCDVRRAAAEGRVDDGAVRVHAVDEALGGIEVHTAEDNRLQDVGLRPVPVAHAGGAAATAARQGNLRRLVVVVTDCSLVDAVSARVVQCIVESALSSVRAEAARGTVEVVYVSVRGRIAGRAREQIGLLASADAEAGDDGQRRKLQRVSSM